MSIGSPNPSTPAALDVGSGTALDNEMDQADATAGADQPFWSAWWSWTATDAGNLELDASGTTGPGTRDTYLQVLYGGVVVAEDDDAGTGLRSLLSVGVVAGREYTIRLGSFGVTGDGITTYHLSANLLPLLPNPRMFEIADGTLLPPGGETSGAAYTISPYSVTYPSSGLETELWWKLTSDQTMDLEICFDVMLSYAIDGECDQFGPSVQLTILSEDLGTTYINSTSSTDEFGRIVPRGFCDMYLLAGQTIYIRAVNYGSIPARIILRTSDYGEHTDWIQPADQLINLDPPNEGFVGDKTVDGYTPTTFINEAGTSGWSERSGSSGAVYEGSSRLDHSFNNPLYPGQRNPAFDCGWAYARIGAFGSHYWSLDGTVSTMGEACVVGNTGWNAFGSSDNWPIGVIVNNHAKDGAIGGGHQFLDFQVWGQCERTWLTAILADFGTTAGADQYASPDFAPPAGFEGLGPLLEDGFSDPPELIKVEAMPTETTDATHGDLDQEPYWYYRTVAATDAVRTDTTWGPKEPFVTGTFNSWRGADSPTSNVPEDFIAVQEQRLTNGVWTELDSAAILAAEVGGDAGDGYAGGMQFTGLPQELVESPGGCPLDLQILLFDLSTPRDISSLDTQQVVLTRLTLRPGRIRFIKDAVIPSVDVFTTSITAEPGPDRTRFFS